METVGAYEAKTHLSQLLDRVEKGERIMIKRHGIAVAVLQPIDATQVKAPGEAIEQMREFRRGRRLNGLSIRAMIEEGRR